MSRNIDLRRPFQSASGSVQNDVVVWGYDVGLVLLNEAFADLLKFRLGFKGLRVFLRGHNRRRLLLDALLLGQRLDFAASDTNLIIVVDFFVLILFHYANTQIIRISSKMYTLTVIYWFYSRLRVHICDRNIVTVWTCLLNR